MSVCLGVTILSSYGLRLYGSWNNNVCINCREAYHFFSFLAAAISALITSTLVIWRRGCFVFLTEVSEDAGEAGHAAPGNDDEIGVGGELLSVRESAA